MNGFNRIPMGRVGSPLRAILHFHGFAHAERQPVPSVTPAEGAGLAPEAAGCPQGQQIEVSGGVRLEGECQRPGCQRPGHSSTLDTGLETNSVCERSFPRVPRSERSNRYSARHLGQ
jgi:hypothetical protein